MLKLSKILLTKCPFAARQLDKTTEKIRSIQNHVAEAFPLSQTQMVVVFLEEMSTYLLEICEGVRERGTRSPEVCGSVTTGRAMDVHSVVTGKK